MSVYDDFARNIVTPEGLRAANELTPQSFKEFQDYLKEHVTNHMLAGRTVTWSQRLQLDKLGIQSIRPETIARLQADFLQPLPEAPAGQNGQAIPPPPKPLDMKIAQSGFDAIEARHTAA
jgi:hypothetical protein